METFESLTEKIKANENRVCSLQTQVNQLDRITDELVQERQQVCKHLVLSTRDRSWSEVKFHTAYWQEQVCELCGKVVATRQENTAMSEWREVDA